MFFVQINHTGKGFLFLIFREIKLRKYSSLHKLFYGLKVFGKSNNHIILKLILINMLTDLMIILVLALIQTNSLIICIYMIPYLIVEFLVIMLLAHHAQKDLLLTLNHGN